MSENILKVSGLKKSYGSLDVLQGLDFELDKGEVVCVIGPSGSGKSTLLRCLNMLELPDGGRIELNGNEVFGDGKPKDLDVLRREVGMVFQSFNLFPHMTAEQRLHCPEEGAQPEGRLLPGPVRGVVDQGRSRRQDQRVPRPSFRRPAAARGHRPRAGDGSRGHALRRGHLRARPRAGQGDARRHARAGERAA